MKKEITIKNWQYHTLNVPPETLKNTGVNEYQSLDKILVFTGTVVSDPSGKFKPNYHCRTTIAISYDEENGIVETMNSVYHLQGPIGDDVIFGGDLGNEVLNIFY